MEVGALIGLGLGQVNFMPNPGSICRNPIKSFPNLSRVLDRRGKWGSQRLTCLVVPPVTRLSRPQTRRQLEPMNRKPSLNQVPGCRDGHPGLVGSARASDRPSGADAGPDPGPD